jgi:hypothetical protein
LLLSIALGLHTQTINFSVKAQTWSEWLKSAREEIDAVKAIAIALGVLVPQFSAGWASRQVVGAGRADSCPSRLRERPNSAGVTLIFLRNTTKENPGKEEIHRSSKCDKSSFCGARGRYAVARCFPPLLVGP